jgi:hypothetical protein
MEFQEWVKTPQAYERYIYAEGERRKHVAIEKRDTAVQKAKDTYENELGEIELWKAGQLTDIKR